MTNTESSKCDTYFPKLVYLSEEVEVALGTHLGVTTCLKYNRETIVSKV